MTQISAFNIENNPSVVILTRESKIETEEQLEKKTKLDMLSHCEGLKEESSKSSLDLYPRVMSSIDNKENTLNIVLLEPMEGSSKYKQ